MAWYDRLRGVGAGRFAAMRQALPLFGRAPHARPGERAVHRRALESDAASRDGDVMQSEQVAVADRDQLVAARSALTRLVIAPRLSWRPSTSVYRCGRGRRCRGSEPIARP